MIERFTISLDTAMAEQFDSFIRARGYGNRSEAVRDLIRERLERDALADPETGDCVATLSYVYDHHQRDLAARLTDAHHRHHQLVMAVQHVHLDHDACLETVLLRGPVAAVRAFGEAIMAERGVRHGNLHPVAVEMRSERHRHEGDDPGHAHLHSHPRS